MPVDDDDGGDDLEYGPDEVDWSADPRVHPDGDGYRVRGYLSRPDGRGGDGWIRYGQGGSRVPYDSAHEALLATVGGQPDPAAIRARPAGVVPGAAAAPAFDGYVDPDWMTGHPQEDRLVRSGQCPYQTEVGGWGQREAYCERPRSPHEGDWPYCRPHASDIRHDRGRGGYVG